MSTRSLLQRARRIAQRLPDPVAMPAPAPTADPEAEARAFAGELQNAYAKMVAARRREVSASLDDAHRWASSCAEGVHRERILSGPPHQLTWYALNVLAQEDPALASERWAEVNQIARDELATGYRAAAAVRATEEGPWSHARFLAVRQAFVATWEPGSAAEVALLDMAAQQYTCYLAALEHASLVQIQERQQPSESPRGNAGKSLGDDARRALDTVHRWHQMFLSTLRALRDLHGGVGPVCVHHAAQVNVGSQQINVMPGMAER